LGLDEAHQSNQYEDMMAKQEKFKKEFEKLDFRFDTKHLALPSGKKGNEDFLYSNMSSMTKAN